MADPIVIECATACAATIQLAAAPPSTDNLADIGLVFGLFLGAAAVIYMARQLLRFFSQAPHGE